jgi:phosphoglycerate dehydrogenase-like enzyme
MSSMSPRPAKDEPPLGTPLEPRGRPLVIQTEHLDPGAAAWLGHHVELVRCGSADERFFELLGRADGLVIRTYTQIDAALLARAPRLRVVGRAGVGLDNVDLAACAARRVRVVNTPDANTRAVVEYVLALMLDATRPRRGLEAAIGATEWKALREELKASRQLCELKLGILGLGRIGTQVARAAAALDIAVQYHDLREIEVSRRFGAEPVSLETLLRTSHVVTVHVDGRARNRGFLGAALIAHLKHDAILINTSRGFVIDPHALAAFLIAHPEARALLDVHEPEPIPAHHPLLDLPNARLTPHIASATVLANRQMSWVVKDVWRALNGEEPVFPAAAEVG